MCPAVKIAALGSSVQVIRALVRDSSLPVPGRLKELKAYKAGSGCMSIEVIKRGIVPVLCSALCACSHPAEYLGIIFTRPLVRVAKSTQEELHGLNMKVLRIVQEAC